MDEHEKWRNEVKVGVDLGTSKLAVSFTFPGSPKVQLLVVIQRYELFFLFPRGCTRLYIYSEKAKLISNQLGSLDRQPGIISDVAALFLTCASLISQHSPSGSLCLQGDTGSIHCSQASVKPLQTSWEKQWKERLC